MSRKIDLTRIHAINWFGYNDVIDVSGNLLIAGVTGSGKSVLMDLIQLVFVGDQKAKYNQSATGGASTRTLKSYCLADIKQDFEGAPQYMREKGAITYVALEFRWPDRKRIETWGLRIEYESAAQSQPNRKNGFFIPDGLARKDWLHEDNTPLDFAAFRRMVLDHAGEIFDTMDSYRREMAIPTHLNFDRSTLDYLLPTAMSFTFLRSFNDFCRQYILPIGVIDIQPVKESFQTFRNFERDLGILRDQLDKLECIRSTDERHGEAVRDRLVYRFVEAEFRREAALENADEIRQKSKALEAALTEETQRLAELDRVLEVDRRTLDELKAAISATPEGQLYLHLRGRNKTLVANIERTKQIGRSLEEAARARARNTLKWLALAAGLPVQPDPALLERAEEAAATLAESDLSGIRTRVSALALVVQDILGVVDSAARSLFDEERQLDGAEKDLTTRIAALSLGILPESSILLNILNQQLPRRDQQNPAQALREICEVSDERWRPAIEVAFVRKFAIVVDERDYDRAEQIYHRLKEETRGEAIIHPVHALQLTSKLCPGSLAEKIQTNHPVARAIIDHFFGDLMCVEQISGLRDHANAILPDGFTYQRPFVSRRAHYQNNPCVGKRGIERHKEFLQIQLGDVELQLKVLQPKLTLVREFLDFGKTAKLHSESLDQDLAEVALLPMYETELSENIAKLRAMADHNLEVKERQIIDLDNQIKAASLERDAILQSSKRTELINLRRRLGEAELAAAKAEDHLRQLQLEGPDISVHLGRRDEIRTALLAEWPNKALGADQARDKFHDADKEADRLRQQLIDLRREIALVHPPFTEFDPNTADNTTYNLRLEKIRAGEIPGYEEKARREKSNWQHLFRTQVLAKLHAALFEVENLLALLNKELRVPIGNNRYQISRRPNPDREYETYRNLVETSALAREDELFFESLNADVRQTVEDIFHRLIEQPESRESLAFLDYRNYHDYDMLVTDKRSPEARPTSVDRHSGKFSGGENQSPYFIAILACYLRAYHRYERRRRDPSLALVPIDEAFSKLSGERIRDCIDALRALDLQGIFSMSSGNIPYAMDICDQIVTVMKRERVIGKRHVIRNVPVSLTREEALARYDGTP